MLSLIILAITIILFLVSQEDRQYKDTNLVMPW